MGSLAQSLDTANTDEESNTLSKQHNACGPGAKWEAAPSSDEWHLKHCSGHNPLLQSVPKEPEAARQQYLGPEVVALLLVRATVHHVHDVIDGDGGLCNVGGQDDFPDARGRPLEDVLLVHHGDVGVHWGIKPESVLPG